MEKAARPVSFRIEDYAFLSDTQSGALVSRDGCVDWLCLPRFDSGACFAALLGGKENGSWTLTPRGRVTKRERRYRSDTLVLETELHTEEGAVRYIDFMPPRGTNLRPTALLAANLQPCIGLQEIDIAAAL